MAQATAERPASKTEAELPAELVQALATIRYGEVVVVIHDGRIAEIKETRRHRKT